jgi:hypothetical protein
MNRMKRLISSLMFCSLLLWNCNEPNKQDPVGKTKTTDSLVKAKDGSQVNSNDNDNQELLEIVNDFKSQYNKNYRSDTNFIKGADSFKLSFNYKCLYDNGLSIPEKYVGIYGFKTFVTHNFVADLVLYKNNNKIVNDEITKSSFAKHTDENLKKYGDLLYPSIKIEDSVISVHFSVSIPLTDVGKGVSYNVKFNGQTFTRAD